jgi:hypothetical protein
MPYRPPDGPEPYRDAEWLREQYRVQKRSTASIADECDCSKETIRRWLDRHGIGTRSRSEAATLRAEQHPHTTEAGAEALRKHGVNSWDYWDEDEREAFRERLSDARTGEDNPMFGVTGEDHPLWNPDAEYPTIYHTPEWRRVRTKVYERDGYVCTVCEDAASGPLHAHHETPLSEGGEPFDLDNLVTVCAPCHYAIHA